MMQAEVPVLRVDAWRIKTAADMLQAMCEMAEREDMPVVELCTEVLRGIRGISYGMADASSDFSESIEDRPVFFKMHELYEYCLKQAPGA